MPTIGISGPNFSGKESVAEYLVHSFNFRQLSVSDSLENAIKYATTHWKENLLIMDIDRYSDFELALKRPFFLLLWVDAPTTVRFKRYVEEKEDQVTLDGLSITKSNHFDFHQFIMDDETSLYTPFGLQPDNLDIPHLNKKTNLYSFIDQSHVRIFNETADLDDLYRKIDSLDLMNSEWTRPCWDTYFMALCELASKRSNCMKRRVGCIIVSQHRVVSTGYNGTPRGLTNCNEGGCGRCNGNAPCGSSLDHCVCMHAEENALLEAGRDRINGKVTLYCNTCPCLGCAKKIIQVGISEVVYAQEYGMDVLTCKLFKEANVILRQIKHTTVMLK